MKKSRKRKGSLGLLKQKTRFLAGNTFPDENLSARYAARRYLSVCVSRRVMHFFSMCILHRHIYTYIFVTYTEMCTAGTRFIVLPINRRTIHIFKSQSDLYRLSFAAYSLIVLIVFRLVQTSPPKTFDRVFIVYVIV